MVLVGTTVKAAMTAIFVVIIGLLIFGSFNAGFYTELFDLATFDEEAAHDEDNTVSQETLDKITTNIQECCYGTCFGNSEVDASSNEDCLCYTQSLSELPEDSIFIVQNSGTDSKITVTNSRNEDLGSSKQGYALGLLYISDIDTRSISCIYPSEFTIIGATETSGSNFDICLFGGCLLGTEGKVEKNVWKAVYQGEEYGFYQDLDSDHEYAELAYQPSLYKVDDDHICLITTLLEEELGSYSEVGSLNLHALNTEDFSEVADWISGESSEWGSTESSCNADTSSIR